MSNNAVIDCEKFNIPQEPMYCKKDRPIYSHNLQAGHPSQTLGRRQLVSVWLCASMLYQEITWQGILNIPDNPIIILIFVITT